MNVDYITTIPSPNSNYFSSLINDEEHISLFQNL